MMAITLYHNPRCSKSRAALELLRDRGIEPEIVEYLKRPPDVATLRYLVSLLGAPAHSLLRTGEDAYACSGLNASSDDDAVLAAIAVYPVLLERPVAVAAGRRAVIGRPPERVLELL